MAVKDSDGGAWADDVAAAVVRTLARSLARSRVEAAEGHTRGIRAPLPASASDAPTERERLPYLHHDEARIE